MRLVISGPLEVSNLLIENICRMAVTLRPVSNVFKMPPAAILNGEVRNYPIFETSILVITETSLNDLRNIQNIALPSDNVIIQTTHILPENLRSMAYDFIKVY